MAGLGRVWWATEDAGTGPDGRRKERGEAGLLGVLLGRAGLKPTRKERCKGQAGRARADGPKIRPKPVASLRSFLFFLGLKLGL